MVAYALEARHHANVLSGAKPLTMRQGRTPPSRHARIGEAVTFTKGRGKPVFATGQCVYRATIVMTEGGVLRVHTISFVNSDDVGDRLHRMLLASELSSPDPAPHAEKLALADGFESYADMFRWHQAQEPRGASGSGAKRRPSAKQKSLPIQVVREVIGFSQVVEKTAEAA